MTTELKSYVAVRPTGFKVDFDGAYGYQCVDLFRDYNRFLGLDPMPGVIGAKDFIELARQDRLPGWTLLSRLESPSSGDILVSNSGTYGHVAIVLSADSDECYVMEQNGFTQRGVEYKTRRVDNNTYFLRRRCENV